MSRHWSSVRAQATVLASVVAAVILVAAAVVLGTTFQDSLTRSDDDLAKSRVRDLAALAVTGSLPQTLTNIDGESVAQVVDGSGRVLAASPNIEGRDLLSRFRPQGGVPVLLNIEGAPDDDETEDYRIWTLSVQTPTGTDTVYVGRSLESVGEASRTLRRSLIVGVPVVLALLGSCTWLVIGRALRPVEDIRVEVAAISDEELNRRVPVPASDDEISRLASTMNQMLDRLEAGSRRHGQFVADASHELQSPLAAFRAQLEVALAHPSNTDWRSMAKDLLYDADRMEQLVRNLLLLAREPGGGLVGGGEPLDLDDIVLEEAARARPNSGVSIDTSDVSAAPVHGSPDDLRRLVRNLLDNAAQHARSSVHLAVSHDDDVARLDVHDDGPGVPPAERDRVFDRFYRADAARSRASVGTGLGLAIARAIADRHGGTLEMVDSDRGAHVVLQLPVERAPSTRTPTQPVGGQEPPITGSVAR